MRRVCARSERAGGVAALLALLVTVVALLAPAAAQAGVSIGPSTVVVSTPGARAVVTRAPFRMAFQDGAGKPVLSEVARGADTQLVPPFVQPEFGVQGPPRPALYAPLAFLVGSNLISQFRVSQWVGNLQTVTEAGVEFAARAVIDARRDGDAAVLTLSTSDPSGRRIALRIAPQRPGALRVSARPTPDGGVAEMSDSFTSTGGEAFHGFGGRHDTLDQHGHEFYNWLDQENLSSGSADAIATPTIGGTYLFPNGPSAAYSVSSSFVSSGGYGFLLDRDELSHWRMASDRPGAWQTSVAAPAIDYVVTPGTAPRAISTMTAITGRQRVPPAWALGTLLDRLVQFPSDPPAQHQREVEGDLRDIDHLHVHLDGYRIEGWQFLPRAVLGRVIAELRRRHIHPMLYVRGFVGKDAIGTDSRAAYDEALAKGYVATHANGTPYTFISNFNADGAQIDFTNPAAVRWWQGRIREALDLGADGFMEDFGEQVLTDMRFHDGSTGAQMHNRLPKLFHHATRVAVDAWERAHPGRHVWFYTRASYSGTPGSAADEGGNFPGDETTDWTRAAGLASLTTDMLNREVGGSYGYTTDIGGYIDIGPYQATTRELFLRWAEWAALSPFFRVHGSVAAGTHTPWHYGQQALWTWNAMATLHRRARPLITRLWRRADRTGMPVERPLWLAEPGSAGAAKEDQAWMLGPDVLVAPIVAEGAVARTAYVPRGCWTDPESGRRLRGGRVVRLAAGVDDLPFLIRCGKHPFAPFAGGAAALPRARRCGRALRVRLRRGGRLVRVRAFVNGRLAVEAGAVRALRLTLPSGRAAVRVATRARAWNRAAERADVFAVWGLSGELRSDARGGPARIRNPASRERGSRPRRQVAAGSFRDRV